MAQTFVGNPHSILVVEYEWNCFCTNIRLSLKRLDFEIQFLVSKIKCLNKKQHSFRNYLWLGISCFLASANGRMEKKNWIFCLCWWCLCVFNEFERVTHKNGSKVRAKSITNTPISWHGISFWLWFHLNNGITCIWKWKTYTTQIKNINPKWATMENKNEEKRRKKNTHSTKSEYKSYNSQMPWLYESVLSTQ